jgi:Outer membrane protein beta-barrel domain
MLRQLSLIALLAGAAPFAQAADNGFYLGAGYSQSDYGLDNPADFAGFDDEDSGFKAIAGFRPLDSFAVEVNYTDHGDATVPFAEVCASPPCSITLSAETISGFAVGLLDFPLLDLYAKVGGASWQVDRRSGLGPDIDDSDFDFAWGAGAWAHFGSLGARLEYERFKVAEDEDIGTISLSFVYTFL